MLNGSNSFIKPNFWEKVILHVDYDSFFASVEQQTNPFLRNRPIGVTGSSLKRGIICAASREAKKFGVKTAMPVFKAKEICPQIFIVKGDGTKYSYIHDKSLEIFGKYTDLVEAFSIDEAFLDITKTYKFFGAPQDVAGKIKLDIKKSFGDFITCSIGIAPNKLMAKLVSDVNKPNGLFTLTPDNILEILKSSDLTAFCGIGKHIYERLLKLGINTVENLQQINSNILYKEFGDAESRFLKSLSFGVDYHDVQNIEYERPVKSISHQHTLDKNTKDPKVIKSNLRRLAEMVVKRLRAHKITGRTIHVALKDKEKRYYGQRTTLANPTDNGQIIYEVAEKLFDRFNWKEKDKISNIAIYKETRFVAIGISNLIENSFVNLPLFQKDQTQQKILTILDKVNDKWGDFTLVPASTLAADRTKGKISSFLKHH